ESLEPSQVVRVRNSAGADLHTGTVDSVPVGGGWNRYWFVVQSSYLQDAFVEVVYALPAGASTTAERHVDLAAPMLERLADHVYDLSVGPRLYAKSTVRGFGVSPTGCVDW